MMHDVEYVDYILNNVLDDIPEEGIGSDTIVMPWVNEKISISGTYRLSEWIVLIHFDPKIYWIKFNPKYIE